MISEFHWQIFINAIKMKTLILKLSPSYFGKLMKLPIYCYEYFYKEIGSGISKS